MLEKTVTWKTVLLQLRGQSPGSSRYALVAGSSPLFTTSSCVWKHSEHFFSEKSSSCTQHVHNYNKNLSLTHWMCPMKHGLGQTSLRSHHQHSHLVCRVREGCSRLPELTQPDDVNSQTSADSLLPSFAMKVWTLFLSLFLYFLGFWSPTFLTVEGFAIYMKSL